MRAEAGKEWEGAMWRRAECGMALDEDEEGSGGDLSAAMSALVLRAGYE